MESYLVCFSDENLEVERAAKVLRDVAKGKRIESVQTFEDPIVFSGTTHGGFVRGQLLLGRRAANLFPHIYAA